MKISELPITKEELQKRALEYQAAEVYQEESDLQHLLIFSLNGGWYALNVDDLQEALPLQELTPLPYMHRAVSGLINLRGNLLLTFDLQKFFGIEENTEPENIIVTTVLKNQTGLLVEQIQGVDIIPKQEFQPNIDTPSGISPLYIRGVKMHHQSPLIWLDSEKIIGGLEALVS